jgi:hypothetical protein
MEQAGKSTKKFRTMDEEGNFLFVDDIYEDFTRVKSFFKVRFNKSFTTKKIICDPAKWYGRPYVGIFNVYFGRWNGPDASGLTLKKKGYFPIMSWDNVKRLEIKLDEEIQVESGVDYCLHFETYNQDYWMGENKEGEPEVKNIEGVFRVGGKQIYYPEGVVPSKVTAYWNVADVGDGYKANRNEAAVTDLLQCPRVMMINDTFMPPFSELVKMSTLELFQPKGPSPNVKNMPG